VNLETSATADEINGVFKEAAASKHWDGILQYTEDAIVSSDIVGNPSSCIIDGLSTMAHGKQVKVIGWYDNEWGYSSRLVDLIPKLL
jgi:glyceraldehyde 3-phosphate dehydrogenase